MLIISGSQALHPLKALVAKCYMSNQAAHHLQPKFPLCKTAMSLHFCLPLPNIEACPPVNSTLVVPA
jgi:hypothetical protein